MLARGRGIALCVTLCVAFAGCSGPKPTRSAQAQVADRETRELQPTVDRYKSQAVMGFEIKGTTLALSADAEGWSRLDEASEIALKDAVLSAWAGVWAKNHPHEHATLLLRVQNYYGQEITSQSRRV